MNLSITEEAFVLSSLKEFVKAWALGSQANFNVESRNGQARLKLEVQLGRPCDPHHHVPPPPLDRRHAGRKIKLEQKPTEQGSLYLL